MRQPNSFTLRRRDLPLGIGFKRPSKAESKLCLDMASLGGVSTCRLLSNSLSGLRIRRRLRSSHIGWHNWLWRASVVSLLSGFRPLSALSPSTLRKRPESAPPMHVLPGFAAAHLQETICSHGALTQSLRLLVSHPGKALVLHLEQPPQPHVNPAYSFAWSQRTP